MRPRFISSRLRLTSLAGLILALLVVAPPALAERPTRHVVKAGESLRSIAETYECSLTELFVANRNTVRHPHMLGMGVTLVIPECEPVETVENPEELTTEAAEARPGPQHCGWDPASADKERLAERLLESVERLPDFFQAVIVETTPTANGKHIASQRVLSHGAVTRADGWHPGLSVSLLSAIGVVERVTALGLAGEVELTFEEDSGPFATTLPELLRDALSKGSAHAHNRLVQLASTDRLHANSGVFGRLGLSQSLLVRAFSSASWADLGHARGLRRAPPVLLKRGTKEVRLPSAVGKPIDGCDQEACTTLTDLARSMCLVTQHARLPNSRRIALGMGDKPVNLEVLRSALMRSKRQTPGHVEYAFMHALTRHKGYQIYRRAGRQDAWSTVVIGVTSTKGRREYVVAMSAHGERRPLVEVAEALAGLLKAEDI